MLTALIDVILPVVLVAGCGALLSRLFTLDQATLVKVQLYGLTPALAFSSLMKTQIAPADTLRLGAGFFGGVLVSGLITSALAWRLPRGSRRAMVASVMLGNNGNFGLPIALLALGQTGLDQAVMLFVFSLVVTWTVGPALLGGHTRIGPILRSIVSLPVTWFLVAAVVLRAAGIASLGPVSTAVDLLGTATVPMVLLSLGIQLGTMTSVDIRLPVVLAVLLRLALVPVVSYGVGRLVGLSGLPLQSLVLAAAMPTAVNTFMLAKEYDADPDTVASAVALSTFVGMGSLALVLTFLPSLA